MAKTTPIEVNVVDTLITDLYALHLQKGDILVVRCEQDMTHPQARFTLERLQQTVAEATGIEAFPTVICIGSVNLERLPEDEVRALGWVRPGERYA